MYCKNCGQELEEGKRFCADCGTATEDAPIKPAEPAPQMNSKIGSLMALALGIVGLVYSIATIANDLSEWLGYNYQRPWTSHETFTVIVCVISGLTTFIAGGWLLSYYKFK